MHDNRPMLLKHIDRILDERVRPAITEILTPTHISAWEVTDKAGPLAQVPGAGEPVSPALGLDPSMPYEPFALPGSWGPAWGTTWFRLDVDIPDEALGSPLELDVDLGWADHSPGFQCEAQVRTASGETLKALNPRNRWIPVREQDVVGGHLTLFLEAASNPLLLDVHPFLPTDDGARQTQSHERIYTFRCANLVRVHPQVRALAADLDTLLGMARTLPEDSPRGWKVLLTTSEAIDQLDLADVPGTASQVRELLAPLLAMPANPDAITLGAIGHAHIDSAWLWPVRETRRKTARTLANVLRLLDDGSPMIFALPAAQHLAWVKEDEPELFERVREYVATGKIVPVGGMWVEPDAVLPSGESLARQLTEGTAFFRDELGARCHEIWLPDSFGYTGSLPQLAHLAGYDNFLTQKISWNQVDDFPHHTLWWEGIDGTRIFTHFPPADTYGSEVSAEQLHHAEVNFKDKGRASTEMFLYGYGDGGGGPMREMLERIERAEDTAGLPKVQHMSSAEFFERAREEYPHAPVWVGELYLEKHRGTFTSQAKTKRGNREAEAALREAETWCTTAWVLGLLGENGYPHELLRELWRTTLLAQFHDILPGSSIAWVYEDAEIALAQVIATARTLAAQARQALVCGEPVALLNEPLPQAPRGELPTSPVIPGFIPDAELTASSATTVPGGVAPESQARLIFNTAPVARHVGTTLVPPLGSALLGNEAPGSATDAGNQPLGVGQAAEAEWTEAGAVLTLGGTRAVFDATGAITSLTLTDRQGHSFEAVPPGQKLGVLQLANDFPNEWDAWDLDPFYRSSIRDLPGHLVSTQVRESVAEAVVEVAFGESTAQLIWRLDPDREADGDGLAVEVKVDWHEREKVLKLAFPLDLHTGEAHYGQQFGYVTRTTHENTSWDAYRFEVCAHKWLQLGEPGRGIGVINDATYGWDVTRHAREGGATFSLVRATLLRAARYPDPEQDQGQQHFRFGLLASADTAPAREAAYRLDLPARGHTVSGEAAALAPLVEVTGATIESLHPAPENNGLESGDVLVRLYEANGTRSRVTLRAPLAASAVGADLHGTPSSELGVDVHQDGEGKWSFELHPFGVATIRLSIKG